MMTSRSWMSLFVASATLYGVFVPSPAEAGCGCDKPPPPPAAVRPGVTYSGQAVSLFSSAFASGQTYVVTFTSGISGVQSSVTGTVTIRRDLATGEYVPQLVVTLPNMPLGPTSITATLAGKTTPTLSNGDASFTVAPQPIAVPSDYGTWRFPHFKGAVGRDGVAYISLDLTNVTRPVVIDAQAVGYPLRYTASGVLFDNVQGFVMQALVAGKPDKLQPVPGMFVLPASNPTSDSDSLRYSRHEFVSYYLQHIERQPHAVDSTDPNWHLDGTRHIDHDHLILALTGRLNNGTAPAPGATPSFELVVKTYSLFHQGLVGISSVQLNNASQTDSFDATSGTFGMSAQSYAVGEATGSFGGNGDVASNGRIEVWNQAVVNGDATGSSFALDSTATITGSRIVSTTPLSVMQVKLPAGLPSLGKLSLFGSLTRTLYGPGSYQVGSLQLWDNSTLYVDNSKGPVTLYVTGSFEMNKRARIVVSDPDPEHFAVYVTGTGKVELDGSNTSGFYGVVYAPTSNVGIWGNSNFYGSFVGKTMSTGNNARIRYYSPLRGN